MAQHFFQLEEYPKWKSEYIQEACALYNSVVADLNRLRDKYEIYRTILELQGQVSVNTKRGAQKVLRVMKNIDRLLELMEEIVEEEQAVFGGALSARAAVKGKTEGSAPGAPEVSM